jgi:hypothetical protein
VPVVGLVGLVAVAVVVVAVLLVVVSLASGDDTDIFNGTELFHFS